MTSKKQKNGNKITADGNESKPNPKQPELDTRLSCFIDDYQNAVKAALTLMQNSGVPLPKSSREWLGTDLSLIPILQDSISYVPHGVGCEVDLPEGTVDFDFGTFGEISGFDAWRLEQFAKARHENYGFVSWEEFHKCFEASIKANLLTHMDSGLYYRTGVSLEFVSSIHNRANGDSLPHKDLDKIRTLHMHYFYAADLMKKHYDTLLEKLQTAGSLSRNDEVQYRIYLNSWLGFLAVTCEGFKKLGMYLLLNNERPQEFQDLIPQSNALNKSINQHYDDLRKYRNNVFHLRTDLNDTIAFLAPEKNRLSWAKLIHRDLSFFFMEYRACCECHYIVNERKLETDPSFQEH